MGILDVVSDRRISVSEDTIMKGLENILCRKDNMESKVNAEANTR